MKRMILTILTLMSALLWTSVSSAQTVNPKEDSIAIEQMRSRMAEIRRYRPTVALVLSGGGAKGAAHIGVINYLEKLEIPVDLVLGTSMGGLVGSLYSLGYTPVQMDSIVRNIDWGWAFSDKVPREYISYAGMKYREKYLLSIPFYYEKDYYRKKVADDQRFDPVRRHESFNFGADQDEDQKFIKKNLLGSLPSGYIYGQNVSNLISSLTIGYQDSLDFKELPIPFACVATDLVSGKAKLWHSGQINTAMRSTMSIPGVFAPVKTDGMVLVDGGLRDNYPTSLARDMGADIIIGVDLSDSRRTYSRVNNLGDIIGQGIDMLGREAFERNVNIPDVKIRPHLHEFNMMSFSSRNIDTIIVRGYEAAVAQDSLLRKVAARTSGIHLIPKKRGAIAFASDSLVISDIEIRGVSSKERAILMDRLGISFGQKINRNDLDEIIGQIYGTQSYDFVTYELLGKSEPYRLVLHCRKGPVHQLGMGVRADTEEIVSVLLNVGLFTHKLSGHSFDLSGKISANPYISLNWSYDMPKFPTINGMVSARWADLNMLNFGGENRLSFSYFSSRQDLYLSNIHWKYFDIKGGIRNEVFDLRNLRASQFIGDYDFAQLTNDFVSLYLDARTDTFDDGYFPTKGVKAGASYSWTFAGFPHDFNNFHTIQADAEVVVPIGGRFAFIPSVNARFLLGENIPVAYFNAVGGSLASRYVDQQIPFIGINKLAAMKNILTVFRTDFRVKIARNHYVKAIANYIRDCDAFRSYGIGPGYFGAGLEYSYDTILGPLSANVHWSSFTKSAGFYISAGYNF